MSRYKFTGIKTDKNTGNRVFKATLYPAIRFSDGDKFIFPIDGERLETLAYRFYKDSTLWWIIAGANGIRDGSYGLKPDEKIRIPMNLPEILSDFRKINEKL